MRPLNRDYAISLRRGLAKQSKKDFSLARKFVSHGYITPGSVTYRAKESRKYIDIPLFLTLFLIFICHRIVWWVLRLISVRFFWRLYTVSHFKETTECALFSPFQAPPSPALLFPLWLVCDWLVVMSHSFSIASQLFAMSNSRLLSGFSRYSFQKCFIETSFEQSS